MSALSALMRSPVVMGTTLDHARACRAPRPATRIPTPNGRPLGTRMGRLAIGLHCIATFFPFVAVALGR
jgi:hypothetical protein